MIIRSLRANNFMRFSEFSLENFPSQGLVGIFGDNECGKSTVGQMICYALFGRTPKAPGGDPSRIIAWGKTEASVELTFDVGDNTFRITRGVGADGQIKASLENVTLGETVSTGGEALEREIEYILGYGFREFRYSTFIGQKELDLILHATDDRRIVLNNMLGVGFMDRMSRKVAEKRKYHETEFRVHQRRITDKEEVLSVYLARKNDMDIVEARRGDMHKELVDAIRERERTSSTISLYDDIKRKKEQYDILDLRIKNRREHLRSLEMETTELVRAANSIPAIKDDNRAKQEKLTELRSVRLAGIESKLSSVGRWKTIQTKVDENELFLTRKETSLKEDSAKLELIEHKESDLAQVEKKRDELDYYIQSVLEEHRLRSTLSHMSKDLELIGSEIDKVRTSQKKDLEMAQERESGTKAQLDRLNRQREAVTTDEVNQEELIRIQGDIDLYGRRRDVMLIIDGALTSIGAVLFLVFSNPLFFLILTPVAPLLILAMLSHGKLRDTKQKLILSQQQMYAYNISQRGLQELSETEEELNDELGRSVVRRDVVSDKLSAIGTFGCENFNGVESAIERIRRMDEPQLLRARELMESFLATYDQFRKIERDDSKSFDAIMRMDVTGFIAGKRSELEELSRKLRDLKDFILQKPVVINQIQILNSEINTARSLLGAYRSEQSGLGVTADDETRLRGERGDTEREVDLLKREIDDNIRKIQVIEEQTERIRELENRRRMIVREIDGDLIKFYELKEATRDIDCSPDKFALLNERHEFLESKVADLTHSLKNIDRERAVIEKDLNRAANVRKEILALQREARVAEESIIKYRELETLFIKTGHDIKKRLVPQVEAYFGWILPRMTRGRYQKVRLGEEFDISVFSYEKDDYVSLDALSGGTVDQLLISLRLAFARAAAANSVLQNRFLFLDEPFSSFDQSRRELFFNLLQTLKPNFQQIFLISHLPNLEEFVDHYIQVDLSKRLQPSVYSWK